MASADGARSGPSHAPALLAEVRMQRELRDEAFRRAEHPHSAWLESGELERRAQRAQDGLEAVVLDALDDESPPTLDELAEASGLPREYVEELRDAAAAAAAAPARRRRWFRR